MFFCSFSRFAFSSAMAAAERLASSALAAALAKRADFSG